MFYFVKCLFTSLPFVFLLFLAAVCQRFPNGWAAGRAAINQYGLDLKRFARPK
jgi:hypothetical protein